MTKPSDTLARSLNAGRREGSATPRTSLAAEGAELTPDRHLDYLGSVRGPHARGAAGWARPRRPAPARAARGGVAGRVDLVVRVDAAEEH